MSCLSMGGWSRRARSEFIRYWRVVLVDDPAEWNVGFHGTEKWTIDILLGYYDLQLSSI